MRKILHLDLDAFYCAVEEKNDPDLRGFPFAVGGKPDQRGVVASCSYAARKMGVRSAMPMGRALRLCPELIVISGHHSKYTAESKIVMQLLREFTPLIEQLSIDEAFMDVTNNQKTASETATLVQRKIQSETELPSSLGVATNKLVAKIANDHGKSQFQGEGPPNAITIVSPGEEANFLAPLAVRALWGIGPKTEEKLAEMHIRTIGDLAAADSATLSTRFGKHGDDMAKRALGLDESPIRTSREAKSLSQEITFARDITDEEKLRSSVRKQARRVSEMLQKRTLKASTIRIKIRWPDFTTLSRQTTVTNPTDDTDLIDSLAWTLVCKIWKPGKAVRLIGVGVSGLGKASGQLQLWDQPLRSTE